MTALVHEWELERYLVGELDPVTSERLRVALACDPALQARLAALEASHAAILAAHPPAEAAFAIVGRQRRGQAQSDRRRGPGRGRRLLLVAPALASVAVLVVLLRPADEGVVPSTAPAVVDAGYRVKGGPELIVRCRRGDEDVEMREGDLAGAGDVVQLAYAPAGRAYGVILSIDGAGGVTLHAPEKIDGSTRLKTGGASLPHAYELDAAPGFERFVFVTANQPVSVGEILARAQVLARDPNRAARAPLGLPVGFAETSMLLRKR